MIDGQPPVAPADAENAVDQTAQPNVVQETDEGLPEKFKGKTKAEIAQSYAELENKIGSQGTQLTELQRQVEEFRGQSAQEKYEAQLRQQQQPKPDDTSQYESAYYTDPIKTTQQMIKQEAERLKQQVRYGNAYNGAEAALNEAKRSYPHVFKGMSDQEIYAMRQGIMQNVSTGGVAPEVLTSVKAWAGAAMLQRGMQTDFKFGQTPEVSANPTESPAAVKSQTPPQEDFSPDEKTKEMMRHLGLTKEQQTGALKRASAEYERFRR